MPTADDVSRAETVQQIVAAERRGDQFLAIEASDGSRRCHVLEAEETRLGRSSQCHVVLEDPHVSRLHARLEPVPGGWLLADEGISRNGTWVNGRRLVGRRRLVDGDVITIGTFRLVFRHPVAGTASGLTVVDNPLLGALTISPAQRRVLIGLSRPRHDNEFAAPATNSAISAELYLSVETVKTHLKALFEQFGIADLPNNAKRARLVELTFELGLLADDDFARSVG